MNIADKLEQLAELQAHRDVLQIQKNELRAKILAKVQDELDALDAEFDGPASQVQSRAEALEAEIKAEVLANGASVKSSRLQAVWSKPRVTWESGILEGLLTVFPQIEKARRVGQPFVAIRNVK